MAYLLLLDHPASTIPYTAIEAMEVRYNTPTLRFATYKVISRPNKLNEVPSGITAARTSEGTTVSTGASKNATLYTRDGVNSSLKINLTASAIGWSKP